MFLEKIVQKEMLPCPGPDHTGELELLKVCPEAGPLTEELILELRQR